MPRGGARQGTPGKGYANRTDLTQNYAPNTQNTAATGGMTAPPPPPDQPAQQQPPSATPDDSPMMSDPTQRPDEPVTAGLDSGAGVGSNALLGADPRAQETAIIAAKWGPVLDHISSKPDTPDSVRVMTRYLRGF